MKPIRLRRRQKNGGTGSDELELVSTQMLKQILTSRRGDDRAAIRDAADTTREGVLVRHTDNGRYEILEDEEFESLTDKLRKKLNLTRPVDVTERPLCDYPERDHFSVVTSRALRRVFGRSDPDDRRDTPPDAAFDPYRRD